MKVAVVIPFYQKTEGLLTRTLGSVFGQDWNGNLQVIVVDDGSPVAAGPEIARMPEEVQESTVVIHQENGGVASARNRGLDCTDPATDYIAFLDSDDTWSEDHLSRAVAALEDGRDLYCADLVREGWDQTYFDKYRLFRAEEHQQAGPAEDIHEFDHSLFNYLVRTNFIGTSTVVYRRRAAQGVRFDPELRNHEDWMFWLEVSRVIDRVAVSTKVEAFYGEGVNIYMSSIQWGGEKVLNRVHYELVLRKKWLRRFRLSEDQRKTVRTSIRRKRKEFAAVLVHNMRQRVRVDRVVLRRHAAWDLPTYILLPLNVLRVMKRRSRSQQS